MKDLTCADAARAAGARITGTLPAGELSAVTTDSRAVTPGCLFAAIPGQRTDGHDYIQTAFDKGAVCALCQRPVACPIPQLIVPDTQKALADIAAYYRQRFSIPVVGVTGSVGKTTAKEMIAAVLSARYDTLKTEKNFNNDLGVPLTLLRLRSEHEAAVVELGVSHFGDMEPLARSTRPTAAVFTLIGDAHLEYLGDRAGVLREKASVTDHMPAHGVVFANGDDPLLRAHDFGKETVLFGLGENCGVRAVNIENDGVSGVRCDILAQGRRIRVHIPAFGRHMVYAALMGAAVGLRCGLTDEQIARGVAAYAPVDGRAVTLRTACLTIVDDSYNANPTSVISAVDSLAALPGRKVCILGDMLELGPQSSALHREVGLYAAQSGALVLACGELARDIAAGAGGDARWFPDVPDLLEALPALIRPGDAVLVKASRRMRFERLTAALRGIC